LPSADFTVEELKMRKAITAAMCVGLLGSVSVASAQTPTPQGPPTMTSHDPMNANAKMKKKHMKKMKKDDMGKGDTDKGMDKSMDKGMSK
jgi:uncharacterized protein involved in copper resistance